MNIALHQTCNFSGALWIILLQMSVRTMHARSSYEEKGGPTLLLIQQNEHNVQW